MTQWYYRLGPQSSGPVGKDVLIDLFRKGQISRTTRIRPDDSGIWSAFEASEIADEVGIRVQTVYDDDGGVLKMAPEKIERLSVRWNIFRVTLIIYGLMCLASVTISALLAYSTLIDPPFPEDLQPEGALIRLFALNTLVSQPRVLVFVFCAIAYGFFFQQAMRNVRLLGAREATMSPVSTWIWYFVPFANLMMPGKAVGQIWSASQRLNNVRPGTGPVPVWWILWIVQAFLLRLSDLGVVRLTYSVRFFEPLEVQLIVIAQFLGYSCLLLSTVALYLLSGKIAQGQKSLTLLKDVNAFN